MMDTFTNAICYATKKIMRIMKVALENVLYDKEKGILLQIILLLIIFHHIPIWIFCIHIKIWWKIISTQIICNKIPFSLLYKTFSGATSLSTRRMHFFHVYLPIAFYA